MCSPILAGQKSIDLVVNSATMEKLMTTASEVQDDKKSINVLREYIILLLCPPAPFSNTLADPTAFGATLLSDHENSSEKQHMLALIALGQAEFAEKLWK
jgi:ABC-type phosphate transport system ATPase subunit